MSNFSQPITAPNGQQFILRSDNERFLIDFIAAYNRLSERAKRLIAVGINNRFPNGEIVFTMDREAIGNGLYHGDQFATDTDKGFFIDDGCEQVVEDALAWLSQYACNYRQRSEFQKQLFGGFIGFYEAIEPKFDESADIMPYLIDNELSPDWIDRVRQVRDALRDESEFLSRILNEVTA